MRQQNCRIPGWQKLVVCLQAQRAAPADGEAVLVADHCPVVVAGVGTGHTHNARGAIDCCRLDNHITYSERQTKA